MKFQINGALVNFQIGKNEPHGIHQQHAFEDLYYYLTPHICLSLQCQVPARSQDSSLNSNKATIIN